jgi:hypothetical protein
MSSVRSPTSYRHTRAPGSARLPLHTGSDTRFTVHIDHETPGPFYEAMRKELRELAGATFFRLRYTEWLRTPAPAILVEDDCEHLVESACLVTRKFDPNVDGEILDTIDEQLLA